MKKLLLNFKNDYFMSKQEIMQTFAEDGLLALIFLFIYFLFFLFGFLSLLIKLLFYPLSVVNNKIKNLFKCKLSGGFPIS